MDTWIAKIKGYLNKVVELGVLLLAISVIAEIIWNTLHTPVSLGTDLDSEQIELSSCEQNLREADFYFPIPSKVTFERKVGKWETRKVGFRKNFPFQGKVGKWESRKVTFEENGGKQESREVSFRKNLGFKDGFFVSIDYRVHL